MSEIAINILSTGDPEKDKQELERAARYIEETERDCCPNGCGPMFKASDRQFECTECGFMLFKSTISV